MMATVPRDPDLNALEEKCQLLESRCAAYVEALQQTNLRLKEEITRQKETENSLQASEARFRKFFEYAPFGAAMADKNGRIRLANRALCGLLAYGRGEIEALALADIVDARDRADDLEMFERLIGGDLDHYRRETRCRTRDGAPVWVDMALTRTPGGMPEGGSILAMVEDISERKRAERRMIDSHDELERLVAERTREISRLKDRLQAENLTLRRELAESQFYGTIIGESHPIRTVISQIELVAPTDASVLIHGESGTGKELVAREIHRHSRRSAKPLVKVNCATIPKDLYESEFFGHVKGAFTGAVKDRIGRFEAADGGTIFLDEVGEIPVELQSKLLRILQEGEYERLGEDRTRKVDVRIIAATNKQLVDEVKANRFRDDLFYRLNVFPITVAPLRERKSDIRLLAAHFIDKLSTRLNVAPPRLTQANVLDLQSYDWPGNVRELENAVERAIILSRAGRLSFALAPEADTAQAPLPAEDGARLEGGQSVLSAQEIKQLERRNTLAALKRCGWKIYGSDGAARLLGLKPTTLIERMKRMQIRRPAHG